MPAASAIITAIIGVVGATTTGVGMGISSKRAKEAAAEQKRLAGIRRADELAQQEWSRNFANRQLRENKKQFREQMDWSKEQDAANWKRQIAMGGAAQVQSAAERALSFANRDQQTKQDIAKLFARRR